MDTILLQDTFGLYPSEDKSEVVLSSTQVRFFKTGQQKDKPEDAIALKDVIGCHVLHDKKKPAKVSYICIFSYPLKKKALGSGVVRRRVARTFAVGSKDTYQENLLVAERWKMTIKRLIAGEVIRTKRDIDNGSLKTRNLLVLVNPFSGRKKAMKMFKEKVQPMFAEAEIKYTVVTTEYPGHAKDFAQKLELHEWDGIVVVSGDGLVHEVINGLMNREDWREAIKIPLGVVPGGSGNALAASVVYASTGLHNVASSVTMCTFEVCRGAVSSLDLVGMEIFSMGCHANSEQGDLDRSQHKIELYSFMNTVVGLIADVDIESERLRCLGGVLRSAIYAVIRILWLRRYDLEVSYQTCSDCPASMTDATAVRNNFSGDALPVDANCGSSEPSSNNEGTGAWTTRRENFVMVMANSTSHIAHDLLPQKDCKLNCGKIFLHMSGTGTTRRTLLKGWDNMEKGFGFWDADEPGKSIGTTVTCSAFQIVPKSRCIITSDGERIPFGSIKCKVLPGLARIMTSKPNA